MTDSDLIALLRINKESAFWFRRRRHPDWNDNYTLFRDKIQLNRLTQRQSVNIPLMKYSLKTLLKDIDDAPMLYFSNLDNDDQAEVFFNEYWKHVKDESKTTIQDIVDKMQVLLYGRSFKALNIINGLFTWEVVAPEDILIDRFVNPANIDSARFICREHIYKPLSSLTTNPIWDVAAVKQLQERYAGAKGIVQTEQNYLDWIERQKKLQALGDIYAFNPILGETYVELNEWQIKMFDPRIGEDRIHYVVTADATEILFHDLLENVIGDTRDHYWRNHFTISSWASEVDRTDVWSDGVADTLRTPNKIANAWFSQLVENRTLRSFGMNIFNSSLSEEGFAPQTLEPIPWGWYGIPVPEGSKLGDVYQHLELPDLEDSKADIEFLLQICEKASAATTFQQGESAPQTITLGEVQLLLKNAQERVKAMAVFYTDSWKEFGVKFTKLLEASPHLLDAVRIHKKGRLTNKNYTAVISPKDYLTNEGYEVQVEMMSEKESNDQDALQWLNASKAAMPGNQIVDETYKRKLLERAKLTPDQIVEALKQDKQQQTLQQQAAANPQAMLGAGGTPGAAGQQPGAPVLPQAAPALQAQQPAPPMMATA
ncbi:MAG: hypothetical protein KGI08_03290 [Thaumarchaeota archaeon]|nr:hypothetical protein [Nitrososphaerota archaeon]